MTPTNRAATLSSKSRTSVLTRLITSATVIVLAVISLTLHPEASAALSFNFIYPGAIGSAAGGFEDATEGQARRDSLESAALTLGGFFTHTATIDISVTSFNDMSDTLASAGTQFGDPSDPGFNERGVVGTKAITNGATDLNGSTADGTVNVNFGQPWDLDDDIDGSKFDFKSTMIHELAHTLGFASDILEAGTDGFGNTTNGRWRPFDNFITDVNGTPIIDDGSFDINSSLWTTASVGGASPTGGLFFDGPNTNAANGGNRVGIYSPNPWEQGSSGSHLDDQNAMLSGLLMLAATDTGPGPRNFSAIEEGIFKDIGFSLSVIPEPSTYVLFLAMISGIYAYNRRKSTGACTSKCAPATQA